VEINLNYKRNHDSVVGRATSLGMDGPGFRYWQERNFSLSEIREERL
jgi:hypothetical protein